MNEILDFFSKDQEYTSFERSLRRESSPLMVSGVCESARCAFCCAVAADTSKKLLIITSDEKEAYRMSRDMEAFGHSAPVFPSRDFIFDKISSSSHEFEYSRISVLDELSAGQNKMLLTVPDAVMQYTIPREKLAEMKLTISRGDTLPAGSLERKLVYLGYFKSNQVEGAGQFAVRGGIFDIYSPQYKYPVRIDLYGDEVDLLGHFDIATQRRFENIEAFSVLPVTEFMFDDTAFEKVNREIRSLLLSFGGAERHRMQMKQDFDDCNNKIVPKAIDKYSALVYESRETLLNYTEDYLVVIFESTRVRERIKSFIFQTDETIGQMVKNGLASYKSASPFMRKEEFLSKIDKRLVCVDSFMTGGAMVRYKEEFNVITKPTVPLTERFELFTDEIISYLAQKSKVLICVGSSRAKETMIERLCDSGINAHTFGGVLYPSIAAVAENNSSGVLRGFELPRAGFVLLTDTEIGKTDQKQNLRSKKYKKSEKIASYADLNIGDLVVHANHGIGKYLGIQNVVTDGASRDYIKIGYAGNDSLYVPCNLLDLVSKYIGGGNDENVRLSKMSSGEWQRAKAKARSQAGSIAKELIELYSQRQKRQGYAFMPDDDLQHEFDTQFEFAETEGQLTAIAEIKDDMQKLIPMDRLLCGDVGFGKTEVAIRAAFKCVNEGKQAAILVPTTILAWQHYQTLLSRFRGFPVKIAMLSRFVSKPEQRAILRDLSCGKVDIIIGTHRLLQKDIVFNELGLMIVDEEQRFGVTHKERLKQIAVNVDCLTLTATPIPRTLNMALSGIRDMSVLEEAPQDRLPVQSYVLEHDDDLIFEAIKKELRRGGQVFYLHNFIDSIHACAAKLAERFPEAAVAIGHGQMDKEELSDVWQNMVDGNIDILVCTTIIETGIDIANANTLIIENANRMGLSQLHQIRGRVGRSSRKAYAYFTYRASTLLSEIATKRLEAIKEFTEFGSGFKIAMRDLELRGAGDLLGAEQSGNIEAVGYDLYIKILEDAVNAEKGIYKTDTKACVLDLCVDAYIDPDYIPSSQQRMDVYRKIASLDSLDECDDLEDELSDRFGHENGNIPTSVKNLMEISLQRNIASLLGFSLIEQKTPLLTLYSDKLNIDACIAMSKQNEFKGRIMLTDKGKRHMSVRLNKGESGLSVMKSVLSAYYLITENKTVEKV